MRSINIGLSEEQRCGVIELLNQDLSDAYLLVVKTKKYHWDVIGPQFRSLHELWDEHYETLSASIDAYAERVRMLGGYPVGTLAGFLERATLKEYPSDLPTTTEMVSRLTEDHEAIVRNLREHVNACSEKYGDEGTADFLTGLMEQHEEMAWMLRSFIEGETLEPSGTREGMEHRQPAGVS